MGFLNTAAAIVGFFTPAVVGYLTFQNVSTLHPPGKPENYSLTTFPANYTAMAKSLLDIQWLAVFQRYHVPDFCQIRTPTVEFARETEPT